MRRRVARKNARGVRPQARICVVVVHHLYNDIIEAASDMRCSSFASARPQAPYGAAAPCKTKMCNPIAADCTKFLAGAEGLEPSTKVLETHVLPLHHAPVCRRKRSCASRNYYTGFFPTCQEKFLRYARAAEMPNAGAWMARGVRTQRAGVVGDAVLPCSPSGKMILNTKKKIVIDTPPVMNVTSRL